MKIFYVFVVEKALYDLNCIDKLLSLKLLEILLSYSQETNSLQFDQKYSAIFLNNYNSIL